MKQNTLKKYLDEVCDMLDTYGGRDKVIFCSYFPFFLIVSYSYTKDDLIIAFNLSN